MEKEENFSNNSSRRKFIKNAALGVGFISTAGSFSYGKEFKDSIPLVSPEKNGDNLNIKMAGYDFPRLKALFDKKVDIKGCSFDIVKGSIGDLNTNAFSGLQTYDVTEIGLHPFMLAYANDNFRDYRLLPIFPLRLFRHKSIFVHADSGIETPQDLKGKKVGTAGYSSTSLTWIRGMLKDEYGVNPNDIQWVISNKDSSADSAGKTSKQEQVIPDGVSVTIDNSGKDESELLLSREVDALFHGVEPKAFVKGNPKVIRLFKDSRKTEHDYFAKTSIFPIMHVIAIKTALLEKHSWLAESIFNAYSEAKTINYNYMRKLAWAYDTLPWYGQELEETRKLMGDNFWPYGIEPNRKTLETLFRYSYDQGLSGKNLTIEELFHPSSLELEESF